MQNLKFIIASLLVVFIIFSCDKDNIITNFDGATFTGNAGGCGTFSVYKFNTNKDLSITVRGERDVLNLSTDEQSYNLANTAGLDVGIAQFNKAANSYYCDDVVEDDEAMIIHNWGAVSGTVRIQITEDSISVSSYELIYKINIKVEDLEFVDPDGNTQNVDAVEFTDITVGWLPG